MSAPITGRKIVEDLEELAAAGAIDEVAVAMVRNGLRALARRIQTELELNALDPAINRREVLELIEPTPPPRSD